jgi:hypothetical protein
MMVVKNILNLRSNWIIYMKILCFIFSWKGQFANAINLEEQLAPFVDNLVVINSDDDNKPEHWINIGNECYFSDQFRKALELANQYDYDVLWHIQADASHKDWEPIINAAKQTKEKYDWGVYAPNVDDTFYIPERTDVFNLENNLKVVATPDNTCWMMAKEMVDKMRENLHLMETNQLGWGWDLIICGLAHTQHQKVIRDYNFTIDHPTSGYKKEQAEKEMAEMFGKCPDFLKEAIYYIKVDPRMLNKYYPGNNFKIEEKFVYVG